MQDMTHEISDTHLFGPVPSRRLGLSLGVDIVPFKVCSLDCIYCQLGRTTDKTIERREYVPVELVLDELKNRLAEGLHADFITLSGSGEPTLNSRFGELVAGIKKITDIPVAILTNSTMLTEKDVRDGCARADVVLPSLDAADESVFRKVNRPHSSISIENVVEGLCAFRNEFAGQIWLEVFLVEGLNTDTEQIDKIKGLIERIHPDKVQLNTAVRPTAEPGLERISLEKLQSIAEVLGRNCEIVADFSTTRTARYIESKAEYVLSMLKRRPCSLNDICSGLGLHRNEVLKYIAHFQQQGIVRSEQKDGTIFFSVAN
jgi:wyosine [tRNA(Phe)-imidazoG37] synthetase (radical SAM superfamily)